MNDIDMRTFAANLGTTTTMSAGTTVFEQGADGDCAYVVQSGRIELLVEGSKIDEVGPNDVLGYMSLIDGSARSSTARAIEDVEVSIIDARRFRFMVDEIPNFSMYIMNAMAQRIRGMVKAI